MKPAASLLLCIVLGAPALASAQAQDAEVDPPPPPPPKHTYGAPIQPPILHRHLPVARHAQASHSPVHTSHNPAHSKHPTQSSPSAPHTPTKTTAPAR
jgi:hypothetical protein